MKQIVQLATLLLLSCVVQFSKSADLVIRIPGDLSQQDGFYRLDYSPPVGFPAANTTFRPQAISDKMEFSRGLPGTKYDFRLYYSNSSIADWLTWTASITTAPDPPSNLSIDVNGGKGKVALLRYITCLHSLPKKMHDPKGEGNSSNIYLVFFTMGLDGNFKFKCQIRYSIFIS